jgi:hypothetical protein
MRGKVLEVRMAGETACLLDEIAASLDIDRRTVASLLLTERILEFWMDRVLPSEVPA